MELIVNGSWGHFHCNKQFESRQRHTLVVKQVVVTAPLLNARQKVRVARVLGDVLWQA